MHIKFYTRTPMKNIFSLFFSIKHGYFRSYLEGGERQASSYRRIHTTEASEDNIYRADDTPVTSNVQPCVIIYEPRH